MHTLKKQWRAALPDDVAFFYYKNGQPMTE